ncbi:hypothetical protein [Brachyspira aalborgi]|uniref:hypothetical protein n=1 Tax=Brachyspira aalborgi TaxID=29522 RepID=UPI00266B4442|nr:hypothetical protein [Brachyspira aalborgi]
MLKKIKEYLNKREEAKFKANMTDAKIYSERLRKLYPDLDIDWDYSEEKYDKYGNVYRDKEIIAIVSCSDYCIDNDKAIKQFVKNGGILIWINDFDMYKKVKYLKKKNIDYLLIQDKSELGYNNKNMNIFDSESENDLYGEPEIECKEFVKNGGLIIYLNDKNLDKKIEILDEKGIPFMLVSEERYLEFNNENRRIDWQKEL